jgi:F0F1-type ATP synthase membrane subunit b/b'
LEKTVILEMDIFYSLGYISGAILALYILFRIIKKLMKKPFAAYLKKRNKVAKETFADMGDSHE